MVVAAQENNSHTNSPYVVDARVRIGHVHLKVADLQRALRFYAGVLGMEVMQRYGDGAVFLSAGGYPPYNSVYTPGGLGGPAPPGGHDGAIPYGNCLSDASGAGDGIAESAGGENSSAGRGGPWRE